MKKTIHQILIDLNEQKKFKEARKIANNYLKTTKTQKK